MTGRLQASRILRRAAGWLVAVLGSVGVLASLAGLLAVLLLFQRFDRPLAETVDKFNAAADAATAAATSVTGQIEVARGFISGLDERIKARVRDRLALDDEDMARIDAAREQVRFVIDRARSWSELAGASLELIEHVAGLSGGEWGEFAGFAARCRKEIDETERILDELSDRLAEVRAGPPERVSVLQEIAARLDNSLAKLQGIVAESVMAVSGLKTKVTNLQAGIHRVVRVSAVAFALLLVWQAAAQVCLARAGWRLRART
ncbi:MAG TPA: hypothetical protein VIH35_02955 [Kiritimatiellia bacterium]|jgi:hypothetical protein